MSLDTFRNIFITCCYVNALISTGTWLILLKLVGFFEVKEEN